jgi:N-6 DNA Methylase
MRRQPFTTIRTEGGLFPPDFLQRVTESSSTIPGLTPEAYHLAGKEKLTEAASRSWNRLLGIWTVFYATNIPAGDPGTTTTREKWLLPLFGELGYGRLQQAKAVEVNGRSYPVSHGWQNVPIHLVGRNIDLDHRTAGVAGAARASPHSLVQELLNRREESQWGFVSNGLKLRLLRDNRSLTRQAYVDFDLVALMEGQAFSDFVLLWLMCHESRVEAVPPEPCWLEKWATEAREQGTRALNELRKGVKQAIESLGRGFLKHRANKALLEKLHAGSLDRQDYYRQLLRVVYRLIFLFVAEARELLLTAEPGNPAAERYNQFYSIARLRTLASARRGTTHGDLWQSLQVVMRGLGSEHGTAELGLPPLGSFLWRDSAAPDLDQCELANTHLLEAVYSLAFRGEGDIRRRIDWRNLGPEELGSVYESLLELHPILNSAAATFDLNEAPGNERKETGSYYTPTSLVDCLLDSALDPVLDQAVKAQDPERAILHLKVCDPACGSGHFLIAAAHRIARRLAAVRTGDAEPSPDAVRHALRDVIGHCVYGVDVNEMAVELCKVNLWLEALDPGKPLSFLDHRIQCGNSLMGATPVLLRGGIPDAALDPIAGDDPEQCRFLKRSNRHERDGFQSLVNAEPWERVGDLARGMAALEQIDDSTLDGVHQIETHYADLVRSASYECGRILADSWCAAFVWPKIRDAQPLTEDMFRIIERNPMAAPESLRHQIRRIAEKYRFFHWHLSFPEVFLVAPGDAPLPEGPGWTGGFDVVLGNPPWERVKLQEKEWFSAHGRQDVAEAPSSAARKRLIEEIQNEDEALYHAFRDDVRKSEGASHFMRKSGVYPLCGRGDINLYAVFAECMRSHIHSRGRVGCIVPSGLATDDTTKLFFQNLMEHRSLHSFFEFENEGFFAGAGQGHMVRFALVTMVGSELENSATSFLMQGKSTSDLVDPERRFELTAEDIRLVNPNTQTCPIFRTRRDAEITKAVYRRVPILVGESEELNNGWGAFYLRLVDYGDHAEELVPVEAALDAGYVKRGWAFVSGTGQELLPVLESKLINQFDIFATHFAHSDTVEDVSIADKSDPGFAQTTRFLVKDAFFEDLLAKYPDFTKGWFLVYRDVTDSRASVRTVVCTAVPLLPASRKLPVLGVASSSPAHLLLANLNSFALDFVARQKVGGLSLSFFILKQFPLWHPKVYAARCPWSANTLEEWVSARVAELTYTNWSLEAFGGECGHKGPPFRWDDRRRFILRCELDAAFFHLYLPATSNGQWQRAQTAEGAVRDETEEELERLRNQLSTPREAVHYIMDTFPIVRRRDEEKAGSYSTKNTILDIYDRMQRAIDAGVPYQTILDPPPADPSRCHPKKKVGILAFGSLIHDPGEELQPKIGMRIKTETPFGVEYGRYSGKTRGGAPTLVPHPQGSPVSAEILVLDNDISIEEATNMLWRRETGRMDTDETYTRGTSPNSVLVERLADDLCVETVLYTDFNSDGKIDHPTAATLAEDVIRSVTEAQDGKDGISYLADAISCGIDTPLTSAYRAEILRQTGATSLEQALINARSATKRVREAGAHE